MTYDARIGPARCQNCGRVIAQGGARLPRLWRDANGIATCPSTGRFDHSPAEVKADA